MPEDIVSYKGSHGTSRSRADKISKAGFERGRGRAGTGIYFWLEGPYCLELAKEWFNQLKSSGKISDETDPECAIIIASLKAYKSEVLDLENYTLKNKIAQLRKEKKFTGNSRALHECFVNQLQKEAGTYFKILLVRVTTPKPSSYPLQDLGSPICCVARNKDCIFIDNILPCEE